MKNFTALSDLNPFGDHLKGALALKKDHRKAATLGQGKTLGMLFFNPSLRTRLSTQKAGRLLGMEVVVMNFGSEGWQLEFGDGVVMDGGKAEHIKEAAAVLSQYCDVIAVRSFAELKNQAEDQADIVLNGFLKYAGVPVINMESATGHPLQALADAMTIEEHKKTAQPKIVLTWAPHPRALPHAVPNSFVEMMQLMGGPTAIAHPKGYELNPELTRGIPIYHNQEEALEDADFVYVKNWSASDPYGTVRNTDPNWMVNLDKLGSAQMMHCLPVRRNVVVADDVLDSAQSLVLHQANNRTYSALYVLHQILNA